VHTRLLISVVALAGAACSSQRPPPPRDGLALHTPRPSSCGTLVFRRPSGDLSGDALDTWRALLETRSFRASLAGAPADAHLEVRRIEDSAVLLVRATSTNAASAAALCDAAQKGTIDRSVAENARRKKALEDARAKLRAEVDEREAAAAAMRARDPFVVVPLERRMAQIEERIFALEGDARAQKRVEQLRREAAEIALRAAEWERLKAALEASREDLRRVTQDLRMLDDGLDDAQIVDACAPCADGV